MIDAQKLSFTYDGAVKLAVKQLSFKASSGEAIALVGSCTSGKSTLLKILSGFAPGFIKGKRSGNLSIFGLDPAQASAADRAATAGLLFSDPISQLSGISPTVEEEIAWGLGNLAVPKEEMSQRLEEVIKLLDLQEVRQRSPFMLSTGQQQRTALASVLALKPKVLLLDEPTAALDPKGCREVIEAVLHLADKGHIVIWATPRLDEAAAFKRWIIMDKGQIVYDGAPTIYFDGSEGPLEAPWTRTARRLPTVDCPELPVREEETLSMLRAVKQRNYQELRQEPQS